MASIAFFEMSDKRHKDAVKKAFQGHTLFISAKTIQDEGFNSCKDAEIVSVFVDSRLGEDLISRLPSLRCIATRSTGFDHIDLVSCEKHGITVCTVPSYGQNTVAEHAFALLLAVARKLPESADRTRHGDFSTNDLEGIDLAGKTIGVIGTGGIGMHAVSIAKGFGMKVMAYDAFPDKEKAAEAGFNYASPEEVMRASDIITLHLPYLKQTHHFINRKLLKLMKKGSILINTSRGGIVDTDALIDALQSGHLGGAGLDVLEEELLLKGNDALKKKASAASLKTALQDHVLLSMKNVVVTPHNAFNTTEAKERILQTSIQNITQFLSGTPTNTVKK